MLIEKFFSENPENISVGIANINPKTKNLEKNKKRIIKVLDLFSEKKANLVIFPEYCLSGYFWENEKECRSFMEKNCLDNLAAWLDEIVRSYVNKTLQYIVFNGLIKNSDDTKKFFNTSIVLDRTGNYFDQDRTYKKTFLPGLEEKYISSGINDTLVLKTAWGKFGFLTCWDISFPQFTRELVKMEKLDGLIVNAAWRKQGKREYKRLNIKEESYYKFLWDLMLPALAFQNQVWVMAANAVGPHSLDGLDYCGSSGIWAPSGINMLKGSDTKEELLILHNIDMVHEVEAERNDDELNHLKEKHEST
ncbi:carbon-nitrogen hydrolase family protein [Desulfobacula sp.]|uniref:carbon-nitrogen hydrolase family protein n=1 Tax=Desulfobacula sp. TaxID=2593537 RepID=UPI00261B3A75|nr:carbon-nitrogen hydrolase family protein [Desulfobacula sp.]